MAPFTLPMGVFPPLELSKEDEKKYVAIAERVIFSTLEASEVFYASGKRLPSNDWKLIRSREDYRVYRERHIQPPKAADEALERMAMTESTMYASTISTEDGGYHHNHAPPDKPAHIPVMISHGSVDGQLDDALYGIFADDDASWKFKTTYLQEKLEDARILAKIRGPSVEDPYRYLAIKWFTREHPAGVMGSVIHRRDYLVLEATGKTFDSRGEPVSFCMLHSIAVPEIRELTEMKTIRGVLSFCYITRQATPTSLDIYCRGFSDPRGDFPVGLCAKVAADNICAAVNVIECSYMKKLMWLVQQKQEEEDADRSTRSTRSRMSVTGVPTVCYSCHRKMNKFGSFLSGSACRICRNVRCFYMWSELSRRPQLTHLCGLWLTQMVCTKCSVEKKPIVDTSDRIARKPFTFCLACLMKAKEYPASIVAIDEVRRKNRRRTTRAARDETPMLG